MSRGTRVLQATLLLAAAASCVKAPNVSVVDSKTALEAQAAGEFHALENELDQAGISPRGEAIPREALVVGVDAAKTEARGSVAQLFIKVESDADHIDDMLLDHCLGESTTGLLVATPDKCRSDVDTAEMTRLVGRENLHRRQIWQLIQEQRPGQSVESIAARWRVLHLERVICGGLVEVSAQKWEAKKCG